MMMCPALPNRAEGVVYRLLAAERRRGGCVIRKSERQNISGRLTISRWGGSAPEGAQERGRVFRERNEPLADITRKLRTRICT